MKVVLIEPDSERPNVYNYARLPRTGLPIIGQVLTDLGHDVVIYCESLAPIDWIDVFSADVVGFSTLTITAPRAYRLAKRLRNKLIPVIFGGSHVTFMPDEALEYGNYVVRGEGHETIVELIEYFESKRDISEILGVSYKDFDGEIFHNADRPACSQDAFADLPAPNFQLMVGYENMTSIPVMTQWGCPYDCDFCSVIQLFGRKVRHRPIEDVLDEIGRYSVGSSIFFYDDIFIVDKRRTKALLQGMIDRGFQSNWSAQVRASSIFINKRTGELDHELLKLMKDSGCRYVYCGFESVSQKALDGFNKKQSVADIANSIKAFHQYGIKVHGMFVVGADTDEVQDVRNIADFAIKHELDTLQMMMLIPLPGTKFYERMIAEGRLLTTDFTLYDGHHCVVRPKLMLPQHLQYETFRAMARFYSLNGTWERVKRDFPYVANLFMTERDLWTQLPRGLWSVLKGKVTSGVQVYQEVMNVLSPALKRELNDTVGASVIRLYARTQVNNQWAQAQGYHRFLETLRVV